MKYIPYDYLVERANCFPFVYRLVYLKILETAPVKTIDVKDMYKSGYDAGYEYGLKDGLDLGLFGAQDDGNVCGAKKRRRIKR